MASKAMVKKSTPKCLAILNRGIQTNNDFARAMCALMADLGEGRITPAIGNAITNAGGKLLKVIDMTYKYGTSCESGPDGRLLELVSEGSDEKP